MPRLSQTADGNGELLMSFIVDYLNGVATKGNCNDCGHAAEAAKGCRCMAQWCPCHHLAFGHKYGFHSCNCKGTPSHEK